MVKKFICYPAIIEETNKVYNIYFPDLVSCSANGETLQEAIETARENLGLHYVELEDDNIEIKDPSNPQDIKLNENQRLIYIDVNMKWAREKDKFKSIPKAVTLPKWLNQKAIESGVNVSQVLQKALIETLDLKED